MADVDIRGLDVEIESITNTLDSLKENLKCDFDEYLLKKRSLSESKNISNDSHKLVDSLSAYEQRITPQTQKYVCNLNKDVQTIWEKLDTVVESSLFVKKLVALHQHLECVKQNTEVDCYKAAENLIKSKYLIEVCSKGGRFFDFYKEKNEEYYHLLTTVAMTTFAKWNELVTFKLIEHDNKKKSSSLCISGSSHESLETVFKTIELLKVTYKEKFHEHLIKDILKPIILYSCTLNVNEDKGASILTIDYSVKSSKMPFIEVIEALIEVFKFINSSLDLHCESSADFIPAIGSLSSNELLTLFIDEHLFKRIPLKHVLLVEYKQVVNEINRLVSVLTEKRFLTDDNSLVKEYCGDIENLFESKVGSRYKEVSIPYMKKDLHDMMSIKSVILIHPMPDLCLVHLSLDETSRDCCDKFITLFNSSERKLNFPECQVSKSIDELVNLIRDCLTEASQRNSKLSICLHNTAHEIVNEYLKSPDYHRKLLDSIPQQSAIIFNNTIYLIMKLVQFHMEFKIENLFAEPINQLQNMAFGELLKQIVIQENIMTSSLQKSGLQDLSELEVFPKTVEKVVRQCLRQAMLLQTVWFNVLPVDVYCIVIGQLVNRFIDEVITLILSASDIREDIANHLVDLFTIITDKAPQVFPESREIHRFVRSWIKLRELGLVLGGNLAEISERWAGGSGLLAHELQAVQVRALILALFQPSDIRQRTLSSIK